MATKNVSRGKTALMLIGLYLAYASAFTTNLVTPVTSLMLEDFANYPEPVINFLISGATLFTLGTSFLVGILAKYVSKRKLQIACTAIYSIGGLGMVFATKLPLFLAFRMCCGVGSGCAMITIPGIICELWPEGRERTRYMSLMTTTGLVIAMIFSFFSGVIADRSSNWHNVFWLEIVAVFSFITAIFFVPETPPEGKSNAVKNAEGGPAEKKKVNIPFLLVIIAGQFLMQCLYSVMYYLSDLYVSQTGIGTASLTGLNLSVASASSAVLTLAATAMIMKLRRWTAPGTWLIAGLSFLVLGLFPNPIVFVTFCGTAAGFATINYVYYQVKFTELAPPDKLSMFMTMNTFASTVSMFLSPYVPSLFRVLFGAQNMKESFLWLGIIMLAITAISILLIFIVRDEHDKPKPEAVASGR